MEMDEVIGGVFTEVRLLCRQGSSLTEHFGLGLANIEIKKCHGHH
jgi:hypothetical protein